MNKDSIQIRRFFKRIRTMFLHKSDFSIISNNCWGGATYQFFGLPYNSCTIGLLIPPRDYNLFCKDVEYYMKSPLVSLQLEESKNIILFRELEALHGKLVLGRIEDVEICFLHYKTFDEAYEKWERRKKRVRTDNLIYKNNDNNGMTLDILKEWCEIVQNKNSIFITNNTDMYSIAKEKCKKTIYRDKAIAFHGNVDDTSHFGKEFDLIKIINEVMR